MTFGFDCFDSFFKGRKAFRSRHGGLPVGEVPPHQQPLERCYHAFYNLMSDEVKDLKEKCKDTICLTNITQLFLGLLSNDIMDYWYVSQGKITVPSIYDREDMQFANEAFDILGFTQEEK